ncbi:MAG: thiamine phosphate synthase [Dehalococcoidia bacterium]|nr:thiamine phosphate synthase [Dehalococcoidia bacterium]
MTASSGLLGSVVFNPGLLEQAVRAHLSRSDLVEALQRLRAGLSLPIVESEGVAVPLAAATSLARHLREMVTHLPPGSLGPDAAKTLQSVEEALGQALRQPLRERLRGLYVIVDPQASRGRPVVQVAEAALRGGARVLQLRDKASDKGDLLPTALGLRELCERFNALLIINDHADLAVACDAHGFHGGQHDLPVAAARAVLRPHQLVGRSNALLEEALEAHAQGVDYVAVGDIFGSLSKENTRPAGLETLRTVRQRVSLPLAAIGGINEANVQQVVEAGADMVCVISAVVGADDPEGAARRLMERIAGATRGPGLAR